MKRCFIHLFQNMIAKQVVKERKVWWHKNWWRVVFDWSFQGHHRTTLLPVCTRSVWFTMWFVCNVNVKEEQLSNKYREKSSPLWICNVKRSSLWIIPSLIKATIKFMVPTCRLEHLQSNSTRECKSRISEFFRPVKVPFVWTWTHPEISTI